MKILLATDGTKHSRAAVKMAADFHLKKGDEIRVISVIDVSVPVTFDTYAGYIPDTTGLKKIALETANKTLEKTKQILEVSVSSDEVTIVTEIVHGSPESGIVEKAEEMNADVIVVGSHGYNRWERLLLGSVSDSVVHHAPCSVLVVRSPED